MKNDTESPLRGIRASSVESIHSRMLRIHRAANRLQLKTAMRRCVQVNLKPGDDPTKATSSFELRHHDSDEYIAISCPWSLPGYDAVSGRYTFPPPEPSGVIMAPDIVLDRILNFKICNPDYLHTPFWVDKLCIDQGASEEKEMAVHSMDLVYQYSGRKVVTNGQERIVGCSLGLMFVEFTTVAQLTMLRKLLDSKFSENVDNDPKLLVPVDDAYPVLDLIERILKDNWWHRAWIFQEEFLASRHMILLFPCKLDRTALFENEDGVDLFGYTSGEIEVRPLNFRSEVTTFCLALTRQADQTGQNRCSEILKHARRYTFLYRSKYSAGPNSIVHAMSPAIFEDIVTRGITSPCDILAIAANCCRYLNRLDSQVLNASDESISIAILTLFVMNGEILRHDVQPDAVLGSTVLECLQMAKLPVRPPWQAAEMIFIKMCRLPALAMTNEGLAVRGVLSRLDKRIKVTISPSDLDYYWDNHDVSQLNSFNEAEERILLALERHLRTFSLQGGDALPAKLRDFVKERKKSYQPQFWTFQHIQMMMAKAVCRTIAEGKPLWLSRCHIPKAKTPWLGIFIPDDALDLSSVISFAFTTVQTDHELKDRGAKLARKNVRVTSLEVRFDPRTRQIVPKKWMNGLWFFNNGNHPQDFCIPCPKWMQ